MNVRFLDSPQVCIQIIGILVNNRQMPLNLLTCSHALV